MLKQWLKNPFQMGSVKDSSRELAKNLVHQIPQGSKIILEYGAGSGPITTEIAHQFPNSQLISFELDSGLAKKVALRVPQSQVLNANVLDAKSILPTEIIGKVDVIVSSLPLLNISSDMNEEILRLSFEILKSDGLFVQYTYLPFLPPTMTYKKLGLWAQNVGIVWKNFPPAYLWIFRRF